MLLQLHYTSLIYSFQPLTPSPISLTPLNPCLLATTILLSVSVTLFLFMFSLPVHILLLDSILSVKSQYLFFFLWLISLSIIPSTPTCVVMNGKMSFICMCDILYPLIFNGHLGYFRILVRVSLVAWELDSILGSGRPIPVFLPGKFHGQRSLAGYSSWGCKESDTAKQLTLSLSYFG